MIKFANFSLSHLVSTELGTLQCSRNLNFLVDRYWARRLQCLLLIYHLFHMFLDSLFLLCLIKLGSFTVRERQSSHIRVEVSAVDAEMKSRRLASTY